MYPKIQFEVHIKKGKKLAQIKKNTTLRKAILQAAITGQLISSCHSELDSESAETGKELLDKIIEERNKKLLAEWEEALKKNPKAKKPEPVVSSEIDEEEIPFEIPENWCWCRLGDLVPFGQCENAEPNDIKEDAWILDLEDIEKDSGKILQFKTKKEVDSKSTKHIFRKDYVLYSKLRPYLNKCVIAPKDGYCTSEILPLDFGKHIFNKYAQKFLMSPYFVDYTDSLSFGVKMPRLGTGDGKKALVPLPPLSVQKVIVAKLEQVLPLVDAYENALLQKEEFKNALPDKVKKAILQEAITGQLTEAWRKSATIKESGKQLLDRIIEERNAKALAEWEEALKKNPKTKKPVAIVASEIEEENIPFEIPESWCWVKGRNIFAPMESTKPQGETFTYIDTDAVNNKLNIIDNPKSLLVKEAPSRASRKLHKGDVLFSMVRPYLKNIAFVEDIFADAIASTGFYVMTQIGMYNPKFLYYMVLSPYVIDGLHYYMKGDNSPSINTTDVDNFVYPLPPLEEQEEIIKKVEELLPLCK